MFKQSLFIFWRKFNITNFFTVKKKLKHYSPRLAHTLSRHRFSLQIKIQRNKYFASKSPQKMVKAYLRYVQRDAFGMIAGSNCNMIFHPDGNQIPHTPTPKHHPFIGKHIIAAANEFVLIINLKTGKYIESIGLLLT